jgi:hypothetical protein
MVLYVLSIQADLEGVATVSLKKDADICVSVRNPTNKDEVREKVVIDPTNLQTPEVKAHEKHRAEHAFHLALKWDGEQTRSTIRLVVVGGGGGAQQQQQQLSAQTKKVREVVAEDSGNWVPVLVLDCDGCEPYAFHPMGDEFVVTDRAGVVHDQVDLSGGDWSVYDIGSGSTSVLNLQAKFE